MTFMHRVRILLGIAGLWFVLLEARAGDPAITVHVSKAGSPLDGVVVHLYEASGRFCECSQPQQQPVCTVVPGIDKATTGVRRPKGTVKFEKLKKNTLYFVCIEPRCDPTGQPCNNDLVGGCRFSSQTGKDVKTGGGGGGVSVDLLL